MAGKSWWTPELDQQLISLYRDKSNELVASMMGLAVHQVTYRAKVLGVKKTDEHLSGRLRVDLTEHQISFIKSNYNTLTNPEIAKALGLKIQFLRKKIYELGLKRMELEYWTDEQINFLKSNFQQIGDVEMAEIFQIKWPKNKKWTLKHIEKKRNYLFLHRTESEIKAIHQRNVDNGRFLICVQKRWLKQGVAAEGEIRMWREQSGRYTPRIKINGKFVHWGRWAWEQHHGPIPTGMNVIFADNNPENHVIENLQLATDADLSKRNSRISSQGLSDNYIAGILTHGNPDQRKTLKEYPELLNIKRQQLLLQRTINDYGKSNTRNNRKEQRQ
ncbi:MAG: HNH endonuclease [Sphingobacteriaceae bacterium]|nr:HNH endonuclease [Sphingobacteriaceae bacterium]